MIGYFRQDMAKISPGPKKVQKTVEASGAPSPSAGPDTAGMRRSAEGQIYATLPRRNSEVLLAARLKSFKSYSLVGHVYSNFVKLS